MRPSEITRNQFLQSILSAWKAMEHALAPLEDPDSAAVLDRQEQREQDEREDKERREKQQQTAVSRGPVASSKWNIDTAAIKQEAEAATQRANTAAFGASLAQRAAMKNAALAAETDAQSQITTKITSATSGSDHHRPNGHGAATMDSQRSLMDSSETQMNGGYSQLQSPPARMLKRSNTSPSTSFRSPREASSSSSSLSSPFGMMATQDVEGYMQKIQAQNHFLDEWAKKSKQTAAARAALPSKSANRASPVTTGRSIPTISAVQRVQELMASTAGFTTNRHPASVGKRKRRIFTLIGSDEEDEEEVDAGHDDDEEGESDEDYVEDEDGQSQTQMPATMADSPDLLGYGNVVGPTTSRVKREYYNAQQKEQNDDEDEEEDEEEEEEEGETQKYAAVREQAERPRAPAAAVAASPMRVKSRLAASTPPRPPRRRVVVGSSQPTDVVDMTQDDDDDDEEEDEVEDSQMPGVQQMQNATSPYRMKKKKRESRDFQGAIQAFQRQSGSSSNSHLHRLSGEDDGPVFDSPPVVLRGHAEPSGKGIASTGTAAVASRQLHHHNERAAAAAITATVVAGAKAGAVKTTPSKPPLATTTLFASSTSGTRRGATTGTRAHQCDFAFVGTDLTKDESKMILAACQKLGGRFGRDFDLRRDNATGALTTTVTHLITRAYVDDNHHQDQEDAEARRRGSVRLRCRRTAKFMRALAEGTYVVDFSWVEASLKAGKWLPEDKYEMMGDIYSDAIGKPRESRLLRQRTGSRNEIFRMFQFVLLCPIEEFDFNIDSIRAVVVHFGATVEFADPFNMEEPLPESSGKTNIGIVSKVSHPQDARRLWDMYQIPIVRVTWIYDSISHLEVLPFDDYYPY